MALTVAYLGCYTEENRRGRGRGLGVFQVDLGSGGWSSIEVLEGERNPSFFAVERQQRFLYAVHGGTENQVSAFSIDGSTGRLTLLNRESSNGDNPVYPDVHPTSRWLVVANYAGATIAAYPLGEDGTIGQATDVRTHTGPLGPNSERQDQAHPHQVTWDRGGRYLFVPDLGLDRTYVYQLSPEGTFVPNDPAFAASAPGSGPRHIAFHPNGRFAYLIHEMGNTITAFAYDGDRGVIEPLQTLSTLPSDFSDVSVASEIAVGPSGRFVYGSNRGHDSIVVFAVDLENGTLSPVEWVSTQGRIPRHFALDRSGSYLYAENQASHSVVVFRVDQATGRLTPTGQAIETGSPVCVAFAQLGEA